VIQILEFFSLSEHCELGFFYFSEINFSLVDHHIPAPLFDTRMLQNFLDKLFD